MRVSFKRGSIVVLIYRNHTKAMHLRLLPYMGHFLTCMKCGGGGGEPVMTSLVLHTPPSPHAQEIRSGGAYVTKFP